MVWPQWRNLQLSGKSGAPTYLRDHHGNLVARPLNGTDVDALLHHFVQRAHLAQSFDVPNARPHRVVYFRIRCETADAPTDRSVRHVLFYAQST